MFRKKQIANLITNLSIDNIIQSKTPKNQIYCMSVADHENNIIQIRPKNLFSNASSNKIKKTPLVIPAVLPSPNRNPLHLKRKILTTEISENKNSKKKLKIINPYTNKNNSHIPNKNCQTPNKIKLIEFNELRINELRKQKIVDVNELSKYYENLLNEKELVIQKLLAQINYYKKLLFQNNNIIPNLNLKFLSEDSSYDLVFDNIDSSRSNNTNYYKANYQQILPKKNKNDNDWKPINFSKLNLKINKGDYLSNCITNKISNTPDFRKYKSEYNNINLNKNNGKIVSEIKTLKGNNSSYYKLCVSPSFLNISRENDNKNIESQSNAKNFISSKNIFSDTNFNENLNETDNKYKNLESENFKNCRILLEEVQFRMLSLFDNLYGVILRVKNKI